MLHPRWATKPGRRRWLLLPAVLAVAAAVAWVLERGEGAPGTGSRLVRIGYAVEAPYAFLDGQGRVVGESAASAGLIARKLGWRIQWVQTDFNLLITDLLEGRFDLVDAGLFVTPERARLVHFAAPRLRVVPGLLVRQGDPLQLRSWRQVQQDPTLRLAVVGGSVEEARLRRMKQPHTLSVPDARAGASAVRARLVDGLVLSLPAVRLIAAAQAGLEAVALPDADSSAFTAAAFRPDDMALLRDWNRGQAAIVGTPEHLAAIAPFGFVRADVVVPVAASAAR